MTSAAAPQQQAVVLFGGDLMFDRTVRRSATTYGGDFLFSCLDDLLTSQDLVVANLEGPITDNDSISLTSNPGDSNNYTFTFPTSTAALLYAHNIRVANLGNNHILNFGPPGVRSTIDALKLAGVEYFGDPIFQTTDTHYIHDIPLQFINYNEFSPLGWKQAASTTVAQIHDARQAGKVPIVYTHWGIEYATDAPDRIHTLGHEFIDEGAEIVIGSHPHVVEEHELYHGKYIYYSLGNFIFDQYFDDSVRHGLLLQVSFDQSGVHDVHEIPIELEHDRRSCLAV